MSNNTSSNPINIKKVGLKKELPRNTLDNESLVQFQGTQASQSKIYSRSLLGQWLVDKNIIDREQLQVALKEQRVSKEKLGQILLKFNFINAQDLQTALSTLSQVPLIDLQSVQVDSSSARLLPKEFCLMNKVIVFQKEQSNYKVAMADPENIFLKDEIIACLKKTTQNSIFITPYHADGQAIKGAIHIHFQTTTEEPYVIKDNEECIRLVNSLIQEAARLGASDLHFQPEPQFVNLKYRINGILNHAHVFHKQAWTALNIRLKVISGLDIAESRRPQNGRFTLNTDVGEIDCRLSVHPTVHGENFVIRILDKNKNPLKLEELGFEKKQIKILKSLGERPQGLIVLSGPTGSGKTTTLYALLTYMDALQRNIMTLEEPIEYIFPNIRQTQISDVNILSYAEGIKSLLRQDPDVILVSEIRDEETATMALRAAQTGHLVLTTLHTKDSFSVPSRLINLGLSPTVLADNLIACVAQRLVRRVCPHCHDKNFIQKSLDLINKKGNHCFYCFGTGYNNRVPVVELLSVDDGVSSLIAQSASSLDIKRYAQSQNLKTLWDYGQELIKKSITTEVEIKRVIGNE